MRKESRMRKGKRIAYFITGFVFGVLGVWVFSLPSILASNAKMMKICQICEQLEVKYKGDKLLKTYFSEIAKGFDAYYRSKSSKRMDNEIIVKWWDRLNAMEQVSDNVPVSD